METPRSRENSMDRSRESVHVFCRLKPLENETETSIKLLSPTTLTIRSTADKSTKRDVHYIFNHIFTSYSSQKEIFDHVALPLLEGVINGKNGLLFTYGVTGSGKTYTLTGEPNNPGIMPRCIDTLFNTIANFQTQKYVIKSDKMNGFEIQSESDAVEDRFRETRTNKISKTNRRAMGDCKSYYTNDGSRLTNLNENSLYCVFISYIEIYNNIVFDLLDESTSTRPESKILREDSQKNMYVNGSVELEVKSAAEAYELFFKGQKRKRMAYTALNAESSRSHSIFNIRIVQIEQVAQNSHGQAAVPENNIMRVGQLSLVDLAGSERCSRTQTTGLRLKEASIINNSLMTLRICLETLRENQQTGNNKLVPYRDSRLTLLFKNYFEGGGQVRMVVCINPSLRDYEENLQVLKFAEMTKDVKVINPEPRTPYNIRRAKTKTPGVTRTPATMKRSRPASFLLPKLPIFTTDANKSVKRFLDETSNLLKVLNLRKEKSLGFNSIVREKENHFRKRLVDINQQMLVSQSEAQSIKALLKKEKRKNYNLETKLADVEANQKDLEMQISNFEEVIKKQQLKIDEKDMKINQNLLEKEKTKQKQALKAERIAQELEAKHRQQRAHLQAEMDAQDMKLKKVKELLDSEVPMSPLQIPGSMATIDFDAPMTTKRESPPAQSEGVINESTSHRRNMIRTPLRHRRSRSTGDVWLEHNSIKPVPLGTVLQPSMKKRKSVSKLKKADDVTNPKQTKYCLITQEQDDEGELETKVYKGDILPTCGGGAQVVFNDVERLRQESPTGTPTSGYRQ
ncbi:kinesin-like protein KIF23 [Agrilus planipennis]|uniref:Kinesin-like protein n=1 Tax=Agrilus planipennis TaxID=224129 RepID=A0A7F5RJD3_AGRPL|nr:kinesin-like protein KIF23 [Agrilus planipennis]